MARKYTKPEKMVGGLMDKLPASARYFVYLLSMLAAFLSDFIPDSIQGDYLLSSSVPYSDGTVRIKHKGKYLQATVSDDGSWSLPIMKIDPAIFLWNPFDAQISIQASYYTSGRDKPTIRKIEIPFWNIFLHKNVEIFLNEGHRGRLALSVRNGKLVSPPKPPMPPAQVEAPGSPASNLLFSLFLLKQAWAAPGGKPISRDLHIILQEFNQSGAKDLSQATSISRLKLSIASSMKLRNTIGKAFKIKIGAATWYGFKTLGDIEALIQQKRNPKGLANSSESYALFGIFDEDDDEKWTYQYFKPLGGDKNQIPTAGSKIKATGPVNVNRGVIQFDADSGEWEYQPVIGTIAKGEILLVTDVQKVGNQLWVKFQKRK